MADGPQIGTDGLQEDILEVLQIQQDSLIKDIASRINECKAAVQVAKEREQQSKIALAEAIEDLTATEAFSKKLEASMVALGATPTGINSSTSGRGKLNAQKSHQLLVSQTQERLKESIEELKAAKQRHEQACRIADIAKSLSKHATAQLQTMEAHNLEITSILSKSYPLPPDRSPEVITTLTMKVYWVNPKNAEHDFIIQSNTSIEPSLRSYCSKSNVGAEFHRTRFSYRDRAIESQRTPLQLGWRPGDEFLINATY